MNDSDFTPDWERLQRLRSLFLEASASPAAGARLGGGGDKPRLSAASSDDYWDSLVTLEQYDRTFARRIGWKWQAVVEECSEALSAILPTIEQVVDIGCGSGIAAEILCQHVPGFSDKPWILCDRSGLARRYAVSKLRDKYGLDCSEAARLQDLRPQPATLFIGSHVVTELRVTEMTDLVQNLRQGAGLLFLEPGTMFASRRLGGIHDSLLTDLFALGPCFHQHRCPLLNPAPAKEAMKSTTPMDSPHIQANDAGSGAQASGQGSDWCHQMAAAPSEIFQSRFWREFSVKMGIDLRSLPYSWLLMVKPGLIPSSPQPVAAMARHRRVLGRPRPRKNGFAAVICSDDAQVTVREISKRGEPELYRACRKGVVNSFTEAP